MVAMASSTGSYFWLWLEVQESFITP